MSTDHNFSTERRAEADSNRGPCAYQSNALPFHQAKPTHTFSGDYAGPCQSQPASKKVSTPRNDPDLKDTRKICFYYLDLHVIIQGRSLFIKLDLHVIIQRSQFVLLGPARHYTKICFYYLDVHVIIQGRPVFIT